MILYGVPLSPFAARVRLALRVKGIVCEMRPPIGGSTRSPEYLALNPIGKLPVLVTDDGLAIAESETIIDHLDDLAPEPSLMPAAAADRARARNVVRTLELYVTPAMMRLFGQMDPATRDEAVVAAECARWADGLGLVAQFTDNAPFAVAGTIGKADCMLLPSLLLCAVTARIFGRSDPVDAEPVLAGYRDKARRHADMGAIWDETQAALAAFAADR